MVRELVALIAMAPLVAGCANPLVKLVDAPRVEIPKSLLSCPGQPPAPALEGLMQSDVARVLLDVADSGTECRVKLRAVSEALEYEYEQSRKVAADAE